jgi:hypothetical protein
MKTQEKSKSKPVQIELFRAEYYINNINKMCNKSINKKLKTTIIKSFSIKNNSFHEQKTY